MAEQPKTRRRSATLVVVAAVAAVLAFVVPVQASSGTLVLREPCAGATTAQATVNIGTVVDFGDLKDAGDPSRIRVTCVGVATGINGVAMLQAAGHAVGMDSSGLLCSIDGFPTDWQPGTRCGDRTASGYRYWAYFHGTGSSWSYSSIGPAGYRAAAGTVEGWHFVEGAGNPSDPPPGRLPTNICPAAPPPTVAPTTAPPPLPTPAPTAPATTAPTSPTAGANPSSGPGGATPGASTTSTSAPPGARGDAEGDPPADAADETGDESPPGTDAGTGSAPGSTTIGADGVASDVTVLASAQAPPSGPGGGAPVATLLAVVAVAALGGAAAWRFRRRSDATI
jgi:hypothetical protein